MVRQTNRFEWSQQAVKRCLLTVIRFGLKMRINPSGGNIHKLKIVSFKCLDERHSKDINCELNFKISSRLFFKVKIEKLTSNVILHQKFFFSCLNCFFFKFSLLGLKLIIIEFDNISTEKSLRYFFSVFLPFPYSPLSFPRSLSLLFESNKYLFN